MRVSVIRIMVKISNEYSLIQTNSVKLFDMGLQRDPLVDSLATPCRVHIDKKYSGLRGISSADLTSLWIPNEASYVER
jgi:hypothetical protein